METLRWEGASQVRRGYPVAWLFFTLLLCFIAWRVTVATFVWRDARQHGLTVRNGLRWALVSLVNAYPYWWDARLDLMPAGKARALLRRAAREHGLAQVTNVQCPLCGYEIAGALVASDAGMLTVARREIRCGRCDFRLDACRHCRHFVPATPAFAGPTLFERAGDDFTHGRCNRYRDWQPVRDAYPHMARRLEAMGYEYLRAASRIVDSYFPLDECTSFSLELKRLRRNEIAWLTRQRIALIRLHGRLHGGMRR